MSAPTTVLVSYDQLDRRRGALGHARPDDHPILLVESEGMLRSRTWHAQRLHLVLSAAEHLARELEDDGFVVRRIRAASTADGVRQYRNENPDRRIVAAEPSSHGLMRTWTDVGVDLLPDDRFLTSRADFTGWAEGRKTLRMDAFYRWQRQRLGILMDSSDPEGGSWSFDAENRLPPPKGSHPWPTPVHFAPDETDVRVWADIVARDLPVTGSPPSGHWATTRAGALEQLRHFVDDVLPEFGPYEDAMPLDTWTVNHSLLSPYLNLGLLHASEVVDAVLARHARGDVPISSTEGFIRQVIGWREYVNGMYWLLPDDYRDRNGLDAARPLPRALEEPGSTRMECVRSVVADVHERGWTHHIPRLMVLANLSLIAGVRPSELLDWMRRMFVDAADWVMVPNVIGMGVAADDGLMMTKPYAAGGAYLSRMGRYCKGCAFDPKKRVGDDACPFTTLYWDFIDRHRDTFASNPRMAQQVRGLDRLADLDDLRVRAREVLALLDSGEL